MAVVDHKRSSAFRAASRALDDAIDSVVAGSPIHASGTTFVPADLAKSDRLDAYRRLGPVAIVDADGNEVRLTRDRTVEIVLAIVAVGIAVVFLARRPAPSR
jgi:hypothetical protein